MRTQIVDAIQNNRHITVNTPKWQPENKKKS